MTGEYRPRQSSVQVRLGLSGPFQTDALKAALAEIVSRHHVLRTAVWAARFEDLNAPAATVGHVQRRLCERGGFTNLIREGRLGPESDLLRPGLFRQELVHAPPNALDEAIVEELDPSEQGVHIDGLADRQLSDPFDYATTPTLRAAVVRKGPNDHVLLLVADYLSSDGQSLGILLHELFASYERLLQMTPADPPRELRYSDFAIWERGRLTGTRLRGLLDYSSQQWLLVPERAASSKTDRPGPQQARVITSREPLDEDLTSMIASFCRKFRLTIYTLFVSAFAIALRNHHANDAVAIMATAPNRIAPHTQHMIGRFSNAHVMVFRYIGNPRLQQLMQDAANVVLNVHCHQELPTFAPSCWFKAPIRPVDASFRMLRTPVTRRIGDLTIQKLDNSTRVARVGLELQVIQGQQTAELVVDADPVIYEVEAAQTITKEVRRIIERIVRGAPESMRLSDLC